MTELPEVSSGIRPCCQAERTTGKIPIISDSASRFRLEVELSDVGEFVESLLGHGP